MDRLMVQVVFERRHLPYSISAFLVTMNPASPRHVAMRCGVVAMQVVVNKHTQTLVIVTQERIGAGLATYAQSFARGLERQRQHSYRLESLCVFSQGSVVRDQRNVETQLQSDWT